MPAYPSRLQTHAEITKLGILFIHMMQEQWMNNSLFLPGAKICKDVKEVFCLHNSALKKYD